MSNPSRRDRTRPAELLGLAAVLALGLGVVVLMSTRNLLFAAEVAGGGFIVALVVLAMLMLAVTPKGPGDGDSAPPSGH
jgi:peptidoglycan/LPS O-acetylase OafA/YrhL